MTQIRKRESSSFDYFATIAGWGGTILCIAILAALTAAATIVPSESLETWHLTAAFVGLAIAAIGIGINRFSRRREKDLMETSINPARRSGTQLSA